ncbi:hypothetical protein CR513_12419, partial [Mucuna pruriens]
MPKYAKFLKEIIFNKRKLGEFELMKFNEECSTIVLKRLPSKFKDLESFTIPCIIGNLHFGRALCDLGASINLMSFFVFKKLGMQEPQPTNIPFQLADRTIAQRTIAHTRGKIEDVLVKVDKFIFPADFVILDMEEDKDVPIILGQPFLNIAGTLIDVRQGKLTLRLGDEEVELKVFDSLKSPSTLASCSFILETNPMEALVASTLPREGGKDPPIKGLNEEKEELLRPWKIRTKTPTCRCKVFLEPPTSLLVIISATLTRLIEDRLLRVLIDTKKAFAWTIHDIKGISHTI